MLKISVTAESSADPQQVLEAAGDFSVRHAKGFLKKVEKSGA